MLGAALKKSVKIDGEVIGETAANTYFYRLVSTGPHMLATESEFTMFVSQSKWACSSAVPS